MTASSIVIADRSGNAQTLAVEINNGTITPRSLPEIAGAAVSTSNPMPVSIISPAAAVQAGVINTVNTPGLSLTVYQKFNITIWGSFTGTIVPERSFDGGSTWRTVTKQDGTALSWTAAMSASFEEPEVGVKWRLNAPSAFSAGSANWRISQ